MCHQIRLKNNLNHKLIFTKLLGSGGNVKFGRGVLSLHFSGGQQAECNTAIKEIGVNNTESSSW